MAKVLAAIMGASALVGCPNPQQGDPGINGENGQNALIPLNLDGLWIFLKDETNRLDPAETTIRFQNMFNDMDIPDNASLISALKAKGSFAIIIEDKPAYDSSKNFRIINKNTFAMRYEHIVNTANIYIDLYDALTEIKDVTIAPNSKALRMAVAPQKSVAPVADFGKRKNIQIQNSAAILAARQYC
jgi:hypothetical protein